MSIHTLDPEGSTDNRKRRTMPDCDRAGAVGTIRPDARPTDAPTLRVLLLTTLLAVAGALTSGCASLPGSGGQSGELQKAEPAARPPGRIYADVACASCHAVAAGEPRSPNAKAPTFEAIANAPGMTLMALNVALHTSHKTMPNLIVDPARIEDLSAYLQTLQK
jgi:mono/diheme cytochrome c family protein